MALSNETVKRLIISLTGDQYGNEVANAINAASSSLSAAADVAAIGTQTPATDQASTNTNIAAVAAKVDAILSAMKAAELML